MSCGRSNAGEAVMLAPVEPVITSDCPWQCDQQSGNTQPDEGRTDRFFRGILAGFFQRHDAGIKREQSHHIGQQFQQFRHVLGAGVQIADNVFNRLGMRWLHQ